MKKHILLFSILIWSVLSCDNNSLEETPLTMINIYKGELYGNGQENISKQNTVIKNTSDWDELMDKMNSVNNVTERFSETNIDFSNYIIIAVFDEVKMYGGHSIDITSITEHDENIIVSVENLLPGGLAAVITQPFHIVKIPKTNKPIVFEKFLARINPNMPVKRNYYACR